MDFATKIFGKLTYKSSLEKLHSAYKNCISEKVEKYMKDGEIFQSEICLEEKNKYYMALHDINKIEHDTITLFAAEKIGNPYKYE